MILSATQLRRKRRDRAWKQWLERSTALEKRLQSLLRKYFESERGRVIRRLLTRIALRAADFEQDDDGEPLPELNLTELQKALKKELEENNQDWDDVLLMLLLLVGQQFTAITVNELGYQFERTPEETKSWTETFIDATLLLIAATTLKKIIGIIADATKQKQTTQATITQINEAYSKFIQNRVPGIAGDMVGKVASMAQQIAVMSLGIDPENVRQTWVSMRDDRVRESHQELDGVTRAMGEEFKPGLKFPRDPNAPIQESINCFLPDTSIGGRVVAASKAWYAGAARRIETARGYAVSVTPNHPILTGRGWIAAKEIREGDYLLTESRDIRLGMQRDIDDEYTEAPIYQIFQALAANRRLRSSMSGSLDFHGDAQWFQDPYIDIVNVNSEVVNRVEPSTHQSAYDIRFILHSTRLRFSAPRQSTPFEFSDICLPTNDSPVSCGNLALAFDETHLRPLDFLLLGRAAKFDAILPEKTTDSFTTAAEVFGQAENRLSSLVTPDRVVRVIDQLHSGPVFDVQTSVGWVSSNGIIAHNCRCWLMMEQAKKVKQKAA